MIDVVLVDRGFAFVDLSGFTAYIESEGLERAQEVLTGFRAVGRQIASDHGVRIAKWLGDGAMVVAVDPTALVEAALEAEARVVRQVRPLGLRVGVTVGEALLFEGDDYLGSPVNLAARLCDLAEPGEILCDVRTLEFLPDWAHAESCGDCSIRGFRSAVPVWRVTADHTALAPTG